MKQGVLMQPMLTRSSSAQAVTYTTDPYKKVLGPLRSMQKYAVILLTTKGTDPLRKWFGTNLSKLPLMNMYDETAVKLFIKDEVKDANTQFLTIQKDDSGLTANDIITSIELVGVTITSTNNIKIELMFYPQVGTAVSYSIQT